MSLMKPKVLFLCTSNSSQSQMAEGYLRYVAGDRFEVLSAGIDPERLSSLAVEAMREIGVDISRQIPKNVQEFLGQYVPYVVTVCDNARRRCPMFRGIHKVLRWSLDDPAATSGSHEERLSAYRQVRDQIARRIKDEFRVVN